MPRQNQAVGAAIAKPPPKMASRRPYLPTSALIAVSFFMALATGCQTSDQAATPPAENGNQAVGVDRAGEPQGVMPTRRHIPEGQTANYSTVPPTSGDHWDRWADCGFYPDGLPDERIVHNLEHSVIVINYNLATQAEVDELRDAVAAVDLYATWGLTRSYDRILEGTVALAAWGMLDTIQGVDRDRINRFFNAHAGNLGPERIPCAVRPSRMESG